MRDRKPQTVVEIIAKALPFVRPMRDYIAQDVYDEIIATGYKITFETPTTPRIASADGAHYRKRNNERKSKLK